MGNTKKLRSLRREIRYRLFRIREARCGSPRSDFRSFDKGLGSWFEIQFKKNGSTWSHFTHDWDTAVDEPMKLVQTPMEFLLSGGVANVDFSAYICTPARAETLLSRVKKDGLNKESLYLFKNDLSGQYASAGEILVVDKHSYMALFPSKEVSEKLIEGQIRFFDPAAFTSDSQGTDNGR